MQGLQRFRALETAPFHGFLKRKRQNNAIQTR